MSLLLEALQKASKNHVGDQGMTASVEADDLRDLSLEPLADTRPMSSSASASLEPELTEPPASPEYATDVLQANDTPRYSALNWVQDHHMLSFLALAALFAIGYGLYVYIQVSNPGMFRSSPTPPSAPIHGAAVAPPIEMASKPARISGLPIAGAPENQSEGTNETRPGAAAVGITEPAGDESGTTVSSTTVATPPERAPRPSRAVSSPTPVNEYAVASDGVETVDIPASPSLNDESVDQAVSSQNIWVKQQDATVSPIDSMLLTAYEAMQSGQYEDARPFYVRVLARDADSIDALLGMAAISWRQGRTDAASQYYARVLELEPRNSYAQAGLIALLGNADPVPAESKLKQLIAREPSGFLYFTLGNLYAAQGKWSRAQDAYFQAYQFQPENSDYAFNLAVGLEHLGQTRPALQYYRIALDLSFANGRANFDQGLAIERVGQLSARVD